MTTEPAHRYRFGPRDRRGFIAGIRSGQLALLCAFLGLSVVILRSTDPPFSVAIAFAVGLLGITAAFLPISGRTLEEWIPLIARFTTDEATRTNKAPAFIGKTQTPRRPPRPFGHLEVLDVTPALGSHFGAIWDRANQTYTAVLALGSEGFALLAPEEQRRRIEAWARTLATVANASSIHRIQWIVRRAPERGEWMQKTIDDMFARLPSRSGPIGAARVSYRELVASAPKVLVRHDVHLALTVSSGGGRRLGGRADRARTSLETLHREMVNLEARFQDGATTVKAVLSATEIRGLLARSMRAEFLGGSNTWPWPLAVETRWSAFRTDGTWHATYWIAEWPRSEVPGGFLVPLLLGRAHRQVVAVVMSPLEPMVAVRAAEHARTSRTADATLRAQHGFALSARSRHEHDAVLRREHELADGHGAYRFSGYVTVSASNSEELLRACARVEQDAALANLELRRLFGAQREAFCCTLPLGRGCS